MQGITVLNLDKLIEDVVGVGGDIFKDVSYEELKKFLTSDYPTVYPEHDHYFALFKLIAEKPGIALDLLDHVAIHKVRKSGNDRWERDYYICARKGSNVSYSKCILLKEFKQEDSNALPISPLNIYHLLSIVKYNTIEESLKFFQKCYKKLAKNNKISNSWNENKIKILAIAEALKTKDFSIKGTPEHLELKIVPKKETIEIPGNVNIRKCVKLSKYLIDSEKASFKNLGLIEGKAILIPRKGKADWSKGLYIVTHDETGKTETIYKTEKFHTDEEIIEKTTGKGEITRHDLEKIMSILIDLT